MDVRESDVGTNEHQSENAVTRALILAGLSIKWAIGDMLTALTGAWARRRLEDTETGPFPASQQFSDLPAYTSIIKHRVVADRFNFTDPFYRCHDRSRGAMTTIDGREYMNFASYDYLGLNRHPVVVAAAKAAIDEYGTSVSASRIVAGERPLAPRAREPRSPTSTRPRPRSSSSAVTRPTSRPSARCIDSDDLIVYDELRAQQRRSSASSCRAPSRSPSATTTSTRWSSMLRTSTARQHATRSSSSRGSTRWTATSPDLPRLVELKQRYGAWLMVDEAHALRRPRRDGRGLAEHFGVDPREVDIWMGTLSKALAGCGGYIAGSHELDRRAEVSRRGLRVLGRHVAAGGRRRARRAAAA